MAAVKGCTAVLAPATAGHRAEQRGGEGPHRFRCAGAWSAKKKVRMDRRSRSRA